MNKKDNNLEVKNLSPEYAEEYCSLIKEVYDEFVAPDYPEEGNRHFYTFVTEESVLKRMDAGALTLYAMLGDEMAGVCAFRDGTHMSTLFVKKKYHRQGVARKLFDAARDILSEQYPEADSISVFSSPYAQEVYKRLGFSPTAGKQEKDGITYYPMEYKLNS